MEEQMKAARTSIASCLILLFFLFSLSAQEYNSTLIEILSNTKSIKTNFIQRNFDNNGILLHTATGYFTMKRPGFLRWEVIKPEHTLLIIDEEKIWNYDEALEQVTFQKIAQQVIQSPVYLLLIGNANNLENQYHITQVKNHSYLQKTEICFELTPKQVEKEFQRVQLGFCSELICYLRLLDQFGQQSEFKFQNLEQNISLPGKLFQFIPPKKVDIIGLI